MKRKKMKPFKAWIAINLLVNPPTGLYWTLSPTYKICLQPMIENGWALREFQIRRVIVKEAK